MLLESLAIVAGLVLLAWAADRVVLGAGIIARALNIPPLLIGLTVLGFATSLPEVLVSASAALAGAPNLAVANALGSNIANIGMVTAIAAIMRPLQIRSQTLRSELPVMLAVSIAPVLLFPDGVLSRMDGLLLLAGLVMFIAWVVRLGLRTRGKDPIEAEFAAEIAADLSTGRAVLVLLLGLGTLAVGSELLVRGSTNLAARMGISDLVIGLTVVAIGTSLPELAVSVAGARKGEYGLALGNVIGSNSFNTLAVIGVAGVIRPATLEPDAVLLHLPVMLAFTLAFFFFAYNTNDTIRIGRATGWLLLGGFVAYLAYLVSTVV
jgi:cation:H+ antiporter